MPCLSGLMAGDMRGRGGGGRRQGLGFRGLHVTTEKPGYLLSPQWPVWSEALGFTGRSKEDSLGRNGRLHSERLISERLEEPTSGPCLTSGKVCGNGFSASTSVGCGPEETPTKSNISLISYPLTHLPGEVGGFPHFDLGESKIIESRLLNTAFPIMEVNSFLTGVTWEAEPRAVYRSHLITPISSNT